MKRIIVSIFLLLNIIIITSCKKECPGELTKAFTNTGFTRVKAGEQFIIIVRQGAAFKVRANGCSSDMEDLVVNTANGILEIFYTRWTKHRYAMTIEIEMPAIRGLILDGAATATVTGFTTTANISFVQTGQSKLSFEGNCYEIYADLSGQSKLEITGTANSGSFTVSGQAQLEGFHYVASSMDVSTTGQSIAKVFSTNEIFADASGQSKIYYRGQPLQRHLTATGEAKIIAE